MCVSLTVSLYFASWQSTRKAPAEKGAARKTKKDPNAPKRALSAYMFFSQDWRERIKTENPDAGFGKHFIRFPCLRTSDHIYLM